MSESKKDRTVDDVRNDYTALCAKAGHLSYSIKCAQDDLALVFSSLKDLNLEAASIQGKEEKKSNE